MTYNNFSRKEGENDDQLLYRLGGLRQQESLSWTEFGNIMNDITESNFSESFWRKRYKKITDAMTECSSEDTSTEKKEDEIKVTIKNEEKTTEQAQSVFSKEEDKLDYITKKTLVMRDWVNTKTRLLREESRIQTIIDALREDSLSYYVPIEKTNFEDTYYITNGETEAILNISDWHCGDLIKNFRNEFDKNILAKRVKTLQDETIGYCRKFNVYTLNVLNLGDMINGYIHTTCRIENELDVVDQIKFVSRLILDLLVNLAYVIPNVVYRSCCDNHSRMTADYKQHIEKESFCHLIDWWLEAKLSEINEELIKYERNPIRMEDNQIDDNIGYFTINEKNIIFAHGHLENKNTVAQDMTFGTRIIPDVIILAHFHADQIKNFQGCKVFINGTLKGEDSFSVKHRLFGNPTQTLMIFDRKNIISVPIELR